MKKIMTIVLIIVGIGYSQMAKPIPPDLDHVKVLTITLRKMVSFSTVVVGIDTTVIAPGDTVFTDITAPDTTFKYHLRTEVAYGDTNNIQPDWGIINKSSKLVDSDIYNTAEKTDFYDAIERKWTQATNLLIP